MALEPVVSEKRGNRPSLFRVRPLRRPFMLPLILPEYQAYILGFA